MINTELFKEVSPLSAKDCFILIERQKSNFNFPIHIHPEYELNYICLLYTSPSPRDCS